MTFKELLIKKEPLKFSLASYASNASVLMTIFRRAAKEAGWTKEEIEIVIAKCQSSDYNDMLRTLLKVQE